MKRILPLVLALLAAACSPLPKIGTSEPRLVIEGVIESGKFPVVMLSSSVPVDVTVRNLDSLNNVVRRWARVTLSDGEKEVVLTGMSDPTRLPPYIYTTSQMKGEAGKTYTVKASSSGMSASASATVPSPVPLESIRVEKASDPDKYSIVATLPESGFDYASFYVMRDGADDNYLHSFLSAVECPGPGKKREVIVMPGRTLLNEKSSFLFDSGEVVKVKFVTMEREGFDFWTAFDDATTFAASPFFPKMDNLFSNVSGGLGYWLGYGLTEYEIVIP